MPARTRKDAPMTTTPPTTAGAGTEDWAGELGARWLANLEGFEGTIAPVGDALLAHAQFLPGERVLDIGCGGGATSLAIARAVGPHGCVLGIDISPDLVAAATHRAAAQGLTHAQFLCADAAETPVPDAPYDRLCSRFGTMFFADPVGAFANLRQALKPGGRVDLAVWAAPRDNPWMSAGVEVVRRYVDLPSAVPRAPGPFAFAEQDYLTAILAEAGFTDMGFVAASGLLALGGANSTPQSALAFARNALASWQAVFDQPAAVQEAVAADFIELYTRHAQPGAGVMMGYKAWLVSARA